MCKKREPNNSKQLKIKKAPWRENDKEIGYEINKSEKAKHLKIPKYKKERNLR